MTATAPPDDSQATPADDHPDGGRPNLWVRGLFLVLVPAFAAFWIWALFFASKDAVNRIDDEAWTQRAEAICVDATAERIGLADLTRIDEAGPDAIERRAEIVDASTDVLEQMLNDVVAVTPSDPKGQGIVPLWEAEYRIYLEDRRNYADDLRETGENRAFYETPIENIPVSERLGTFADDNQMSTCAPPIDLTR